MVAPSVSVAHAGTLLADVDVIQRPLILLSIVVLDPAEPRGAGPAGPDIDITHTDNILSVPISFRLSF